MAPDSITIYQMEVPYNTTIYKRMKEEGKLAAPVATGTPNGAGPITHNELAKNGYTVTSAYTAVKDSSKVTFDAAINCGRGGFAFGGRGVVRTHRRHTLSEPPRFRSLLNGWVMATYGIPRVDACDDERLIREFILQLGAAR